MARRAAKTPADYLESLPADKRAVIAAARKVVNKYIPKGYRESAAWGGITWEVPLSRYAGTYNGQPLCYVSLAARKNFATLYLMGAYPSSENHRALKQAFARAGKRFDMGKSCLHFKSLDDLDITAVGQVIASFTPDQWIAAVETARTRSRG